MKWSAIILAGGESWRMKPHIWIPKPLVELNDGVTLLEWQVGRLKRSGIDNIVVVSREFRIPELDVQWMFSKPEWGTGGALKRALELTDSEVVYALNCDDIVLDSPKSMMSFTQTAFKLHSNASLILAVSRARIPYGMIKLARATRRGEQVPLVTVFQEKPFLRKFVSCGHYIWKADDAKIYLPDEGDLEQTTLPVLAKRRSIVGYVVKLGWITINTYKDLLNARQALRQIEKSRETSVGVL